MLHHHLSSWQNALLHKRIAAADGNGSENVTMKGFFCQLGGSPIHKWLVWPQLGVASLELHIHMLAPWNSGGSKRLK